MNQTLDISGQADFSSDICTRVREQYERFPYPNYPLAARPIYVDGYLGQSALARCLASDILQAWGQSTATDVATTAIGGVLPLVPRRMLIAGCGEILPYILHKLEPLATELTALDLSSRSIRRARFRIGLSRRRVLWVQDDIDQYLQQAQKAGLKFDHFDAYGVLQCLADPFASLLRLSQVLNPGATLRVMVYNNHGRKWIHHISSIFRILGLDYRIPGHLDLADEFLDLLKQFVPCMSRFFAGGLKTMIANRSRLVDTFFHQRDIRFSLEDWLRVFTKAGFHPLGIFDRYGELDDLANPLWQMPSEPELTSRAEDFRFENNLELYLSWPGPTPSITSQPVSGRGVATGSLKKGSPATRFGIRSGSSVKWPADHFRYPRIWFSFSETRRIAYPQRLALWRAQQRYLREGVVLEERVLRSLSEPALQRLARLGAILPGMIQSLELRDRAKAPLVEVMETPQLFRKVDLSSTPIRAWLHLNLSKLKSLDERRNKLIWAHLEALQNLYSTELAGTE
jgi:hypothetical protein